MKIKSKNKHSNKEVAKVKKILQKPIMRRIGFDFPDALINEFKAATSIKKTSMTAKIAEWMEDYCEKVKKEKGVLDRLTK